MTRSIAALLVAATFATAASAADERTFEQRVRADPRGEVSISTVSGSVEVSGWDRSEVDVRARLESGIDRVDVISSGGRTQIKVVPARRSRYGDAYLTVRIPRESSLEVTTVSADLDSRGVLGGQRLRTVSGNIAAELAGAPVDLRTVSGDVELRGRKEATTVRVETVSGDVTLEDAAGELEALTTSGDLRVELGQARSVRVRTTSGDLFFRGDLVRGAIFDAETVSGELGVRAASDAGLEYDVTTFSGDIDNCFSAEVQRTSKYGPGMRLTGRRGDGGATVRLRTMSGDVDLCDR